MYKSREEWVKEFDEASALPEMAPGWRGRLCESPETLAHVLDFVQSARRTVEKLYVYAHLLQDQDLSDTEGVESFEKAASLHSRLSAETSYLAPEVLAIPQDTMTRWLSLDILKPHRVMLDEILRARPHTLEPSEEELLAMASDVTRSFSGASGKLANVELPARLPEVDCDSGGKTRITNGNLVSLLTEGSPSVREAVFHGYYSELAGNTATLAALLEGQVKTHVFNARARKFPSALEASLFLDRVSRSVYEALISSVHDNLSVLHRYYHLKRRTLKQDKLHMSDLYTPITSESRRRFSFDEARQLVLESVQPLGDDYAGTLAGGFENRWIDRYENIGKRSGAYSSGCYDSPPYIMMNFNGTLDSLFTLAHEAGHSMHSHYSRKHQTYQDSEYPILLAEVASITNEFLLFEHLSRKLSSGTELEGMLDHLVNSFRSTLFRQAMFAEFELMIHEHVERGGVLTSEFLFDTYLALVKTYHGDAFAWDETDRMIGNEWARVPHFYYNFYVYKYATGMASAVSAAESALSGDSERVASYMGFLGGGGATPPLNQLLEIGINLESPVPVKNAVARFRKAMEALEELLEQK
jgi:oligoendopeptidase F